MTIVRSASNTKTKLKCGRECRDIKVMEVKLIDQYQFNPTFANSTNYYNLRRIDGCPINNLKFIHCRLKSCQYLSMTSQIHNVIRSTKILYVRNGILIF